MPPPNLEQDKLLAETEISNQLTAETPSLEKLIDDVLEVTHTNSASHGFERRNRPRIPLLLSILLGAFFAGSVFGFIWGKSYEQVHGMQKLASQEERLLHLFEDIREIIDQREDETIIPLTSPKEMDKIAPKEFT